ncbi:MAG TPA: hypothetical protein VMV27_18225 [Candidatus Binataceae bacterium]|nr:hypothetical protein [Candidatus Binataceae bacterium]
MRRTIGLLLAAGLAFMVAGCASTSGGGAGTTGTTTAATTGSQAGQQTASVDTSKVARDFNLRVKCPGVHEEKLHGWSDQKIMTQESVSEEDIPACMTWVQNQPKGYVPPPPAGYVAKAAPKAAPSAAGASSAAPAAPAPAPASH